MRNKNQPKGQSLKPYHPFGVPLLGFLAALTLLALVVTALYEYVL